MAKNDQGKGYVVCRIYGGGRLPFFVGGASGLSMNALPTERHSITLGVVKISVLLSRSGGGVKHLISLVP